MKRNLAIELCLLLLLCLVLVVLSLRGALGHEWYSELEVPGKPGWNCCGGNDCKPYPFRSDESESNFELLINGKWWPVPPDRVLELGSPDGQAHACCYYHGSKVQGCEAKPEVKFRCVILPRGSV